MFYRNKKSFIFLIFTFSLIAISCRSAERLEYPLATVNTRPNGQETTPRESGIYLGRYKTCERYARYILSQMGFAQRLIFRSFQFLQDYSTVKCQVAHTCQCQSDFYFADNIKGQTIYRCVEGPEARIESDEVYSPTENFPEAGVIKFALPSSQCGN